MAKKTDLRKFSEEELLEQAYALQVEKESVRDQLRAINNELSARRQTADAEAEAAAEVVVEGVTAEAGT